MFGRLHIARVSLSVRYDDSNPKNNFKVDMPITKTRTTHFIYFLLELTLARVQSTINKHYFIVVSILETTQLTPFCLFMVNCSFSQHPWVLCFGELQRIEHTIALVFQFFNSFLSILNCCFLVGQSQTHNEKIKITFIKGRDIDQS